MVEKDLRSLPVALQLSTERDRQKDLVGDGENIAKLTTWETKEDGDP